MKREFSSLSENFSPLQRLACISKVTASVCSFVCVCSPAVLLSGVWKRVAGVQGTQGACVCLYSYECVSECMNPRWAWTAAWATKAHTRAQREMAGRQCQPFGPARGSRGPCICACLCVCVWAQPGRGEEGGGAHTRPVYPPISIRQSARKFQQSSIEWWWRGGWQKVKTEKAKRRRAEHLASGW